MDHVATVRPLFLPGKTDLNFGALAFLGREEASRQLFKIILPASLPIMFTGLRISLGVGWMVLVAADMLAQNPGLGKFVWDMYQNGSSQTMAQIFVAAIWIGIIGFLLDRVMVVCMNLVSFGSPETA